MRPHVLIFLALLLFNVTLRVFTNHWQVLPKWLNLWDVIGTALLAAAFLGWRLTHGLRVPYRGLLRRLLAFNGVALLAAALNLEWIHLPAALGQLVMLNEPIVLFLCVTTLPFEPRDVRRFRALLVTLIIFELAIGCLQIPTFIRGASSESLIGTFHGNAEQYGAFLLLGICYFVGRAVTTRFSRVRLLTLVVSMFVLIVCIDNKASWFGLVLAVCYLLVGLGAFRTRHGMLVGAAAALAVVVGLLLVVVSNTSSTVNQFARLAEAFQTGAVSQLGKIKAYADVLRSYGDHPHMALIGAGPGTFYSRAGRQFSYSPVARNLMFSHPSHTAPGYEEITAEASNATGNLITPSAHSPYYLNYYRYNDQIFVVGSEQVDSPFSPYAGLLGEVGLLGTLLYLSLYWTLWGDLRYWWREFRQDARIFPLITASTGFLVYVLANSVYGPWLETGRMTTLLWAMAAMVFWHDCHAAEEEPADANQPVAGSVGAPDPVVGAGVGLPDGRIAAGGMREA